MIPTMPTAQATSDASIDSVSRCCACGYDLRGVAPDAMRCPECGFALAESARITARDQRQWYWKVRIGLLMMLWSVPVVAVSVAILYRQGLWGAPWIELNFTGPKVWAVPLALMWGGGRPMELLPMLVMTMINAAGIWLVSSPKPAGMLTRKTWLRRALRFYSAITVAVAWTLVMPWPGQWDLLSLEHRFAAAIIVVELPGSILLYAYLVRLAREQSEPRLEYRCGLLLCAIVVMQIAAVLAEFIVIEDSILQIGTIVYGAAGLLLGLAGVDVFLDFYNALREASSLSH